MHAIIMVAVVSLQCRDGMKVSLGFWVRLAKRGYWDGKERGRRLARSSLPIPTGSSCSCISASAVSRQSNGQGRGRKGRLTGGRWWLSRSSLFQEPQGRSCWSGPQALHCTQHTVHLGEADAQGSHSTREQQEKKKTVLKLPANSKVAGSCFHLYAAGDGVACALSCPALSSWPQRCVLNHMVAPFSRRYIWQCLSLMVD